MIDQICLIVSDEKDNYITDRWATKGDIRDKYQPGMEIESHAIKYRILKNKPNPKYNTCSITVERIEIQQLRAGRYERLDGTKIANTRISAVVIDKYVQPGKWIRVGRRKCLVISVDYPDGEGQIVIKVKPL